MSAQPEEAAVSATAIKMAEGVGGSWAYHLTRMPNATLALCGARTMPTLVPLSTWGMKSHLNQTYCTRCKALAEGRL